MMEYQLPARSMLVTTLLLLCLQHSPQAMSGADEVSYAPDVPEAGSVEQIARYTTSKEYLPSAVAYVPMSATVPSPTRALGRLIGTPNELHRVAEINGYYRQLAGASGRVRVASAGKTEEGRELLTVMISSAKNLENIEEIRGITQRLADPRKTSREQMIALVRDGKVVYHLLGGLHATETGSPEMLMELAYRLAVSEKQEIRTIRSAAVVIITPVGDPDGRDRVVDWYYRHLRNRNLPYDKLREFSSPPYWGHYAVHDTNRDGLQVALLSTKALHATYYRFRPQVLHDLHESIPLMYISTGTGPYNPALDPVAINEWTGFAHHEAAQLQAQGLPGVWVWGFWDGWSPGYATSVADVHNSIGRFYETFGNSLAGTFERDLTDVRSVFLGKLVTEKQWYRPWPPQRRVTWSLRNNINYSQAGVLAALNYAALHREELLRNYWVKNERAVSRGRNSAPYAWYFPEQQNDRRRMATMLNLLRRQDIEVHRLGTNLSAAEQVYAAGGYVVRMDQPTRNFIQSLMERQTFPADETTPPADDVAWTWPLLRDVRAQPVNTPEVLTAQMHRIDDDISARGEVVGQGKIFLLQDTGQTSLLAARVRLAGASVRVAMEGFEAAGKYFPAGSWVVAAKQHIVEDAARRFGLSFVATDEEPAGTLRDVDFPRIGLLHTWTDTQDAGWMRYLFDQEQIPYTLVSPDDVRRGGLRGRFDLVLLPRSKGTFKEMVHGIDSSVGPLAYTRTDAYPSHGTPNSSQDITRGMGFPGLENLNEFVRGGGLLVALGNAGILPVDGGIVRDVDSVMPTGTPGSELRAKVVRPEHPIAFGYDTRTSVFRGDGPLFDVKSFALGRVVLQFGEKPLTGSQTARVQTADDESSPGSSEPNSPLVLSGYVRDPTVLDGKAAILDMPAGKGRVLLYSFNPVHRVLNESDFRFLFNAILYWNDLPST